MPFAVVDDGDQSDASVFQLDADVGGPGVERVLDQFLHDGGRTLDHFAGGDLVGDLRRQDAHAPVTGFG